MTIDEFATALNRLRIIPRVLVIAATIYTGVVILDLLEWYYLLEVRSISDSAFVGSTIAALAGILKFMIDTYIKTGDKE